MVISFRSLGQYGRLANQLFQVHATLGLAEKHNATPVLPLWPYSKYFNETLDYPGNLGHPQIKEQYFHHHELPITGSCDILGYFQSYKYFGSKTLTFKQEFLNEQKAKHNIWDKPVICCHVRRGDYVGNVNYYQIPVTYYIDSLYRYFPNWRECNILFISDEPEYCRTHFECLPNAYFSTGNSDIEDMALASCCDHFIIPNSSYGWWCAWFGSKQHTTVIHPGHLNIGKLSGNDTKDYWPKHWVENKQDGYKLHLHDVTFTIPVHWDHKDRQHNADLSVCMLLSAFHTNIIMCEQGGDKFKYFAQWVKYMQLPGDVFHRTKMLNDMANIAETDIVVNWDCDVIIPPMQILLATEALRAGADVVFPYDGRFARMPRNTWFAPIQRHLDIGLVGSAKFKGREHGHNSVGGAVMFNKDAFIDGGMENEYMISFGPEDCERNDRFKKLGYDVRMTGGSLFHMDHYCGVNSGKGNPYFDANHKELEKIRAMTADQLRDYIDTWPWRSQYTSRYYHQISEGAIRSAKIVMGKLGPVGSVIDVGCGVGEWNNGNDNYFGVDYKVREKDLLIPKERFTECDLNKSFPAVVTQYGLAICLEVAEHLRPHRAEPLVEYLCMCSDKVLFSAAIPYQGGQGHVNEQWQSYWADLFAMNSFFPSVNQPDIRNNPEVELWYRNNIVLYENRDTQQVVKDFILPEYYMEIVGNLVRQIKR